MPTTFSTGLLCAAVLSLGALTASGQLSIDFGDLSLPPASYYNGADGAGGFSSGGAFFNNLYQAGDGWESWGGWAYSNVTDNQTAGWANQHSAVTGSGFGSSDTYAVGYVDDFSNAIPRVTLPEDRPILGVHVTNTTYAYFSMRDGDAVSKKFGGESGDDADFFRLIITGLNGAGAPIDSTEFYLADFRHDNHDLDYILSEWAWVDLSAFGEDVRMIDFTLESSDIGIWGMNTPAYFALGEVAVVPEPATFALWGALFAGLTLLARRRRRAIQ